MNPVMFLLVFPALKKKNQANKEIPKKVAVTRDKVLRTSA